MRTNKIVCPSPHLRIEDRKAYCSTPLCVLVTFCFLNTTMTLLASSAIDFRISTRKDIFWMPRRLLVVVYAVVSRLVLKNGSFSLIFSCFVSDSNQNEAHSFSIALRWRSGIEERPVTVSNCGHRGHVATQQASLGNSPDANAERQLRKQVPVVAPLVQRLLFRARAFRVGLPPPSYHSYAVNSTGITLTKWQRNYFCVHDPAWWWVQASNL